MISWDDFIVTDYGTLLRILSKKRIWYSCCNVIAGRGNMYCINTMIIHYACNMDCEHCQIADERSFLPQNLY